MKCQVLFSLKNHKKIGSLSATILLSALRVKFSNKIETREEKAHIEGWAQDYSNSNIFLKPLFRGNLDPFVNNANLGAIAHTSNGT